MIGELYINGNDAWAEWGVSMGDGFVDAIDGFVPMKEYIENDSRLEHGKRVLLATPRLASRELTLHFTIKGDSEADFRKKRRAFEEMLRQGMLTFAVPALSDDVYHLIYLGKNVSYALNRSRTFAAMSAKFEEPNPANRV